METTDTTDGTGVAPSTRYGLPGCLNCGPLELYPVSNSSAGSGGTAFPRADRRRDAPLAAKRDRPSAAGGTLGRMALQSSTPAINPGTTDL